ncbi:MAG: transcriptional repressor LexA [Clostridiales bacterium]|nr:transcriptional repressor LexA [Clostridiales bacterium]
MNDNLTKRQKSVYDYLKKEIREKGYPPSVREICQAVGLSSTSSVHAHLETLEGKGYIKRSPLKNRSIEILEEDFYQSSREMVNIPIVGKVTAGEPILAVENIDDYFPIPIEYVSSANSFMLRVKGDSMINKGILDGDLVIIKKQPSANNGDIVVALIDDSATIKTFYREKNHIRLQPENPAYEPIIVKNISILGVLIGLFRKY